MLVLILWEHRRWPKHRHAVHDCILRYGLWTTQRYVGKQGLEQKVNISTVSILPSPKPSDVISKSWNDSRFHATPTHQSTCHSQWKEGVRLTSPYAMKPFLFEAALSQRLKDQKQIFNWYENICFLIQWRSYKIKNGGEEFLSSTVISWWSSRKAWSKKKMYCPASSIKVYQIHLGAVDTTW